MNDIDISKLDKAEVLRRLYNASQPLGLGFLHYRPEPMQLDDARTLLESQSYFDYLHGRVMKVRLDGPTLDTRGYDRDNGDGAAERALKGLL